MIKRKLGFIKILSFFIIAQLISGSSLFAQGLDQTIFDQIKRQTGATSDATRVQSPLDQQREQEYLQQLSLRLEERREAGPSIIEDDYNSRRNSLDNSDENELEQYGYSIFDRLPMMNQMMTGCFC